MKPIAAIKRLISSKVSKCISGVLPRKIKRLIYLSSVIAVLDDIKNPSSEITRKLNLLLGLSKDDSAIILPMYIHSFIWGDVIKSHAKEFNVYQDKLKNEPMNFDDVVNFFCCNTPMWLSYGSIELLKRDLKTMFSTLPLLLAK